MNNEQKELQVGDVLYIPVKGRVMVDRIDEATISKVGRVYYELDHYWYKKVRKDTLAYEDNRYSQNSFHAYRSIEEYEAVVAKSKKIKAIYDFFRYTTSLSDEDTDAVFEIINKYLKPK